MYGNIKRAFFLIVILVTSLGAGFLPIEPGTTTRQEAEAIISALPPGVVEVNLFYDAGDVVEAAQVKLKYSLPERVAPHLFELRGRPDTARGDLFSGQSPGKTVSYEIDGVHFNVTAGRLQNIWLMKPGAIPRRIEETDADFSYRADQEIKAPPPARGPTANGQKVGARRGIQIKVLSLECRRRGGSEYITVRGGYNARELKGKQIECTAAIYLPEGKARAIGSQTATVITGNPDWQPLEIDIPVQEVNRVAGGEERIMIHLEARCDGLLALHDLEWLSPARRVQGEQPREVVLDAVHLTLDRDHAEGSLLTVGADCVPKGLDGEKLALHYQLACVDVSQGAMASTEVDSSQAAKAAVDVDGGQVVRASADAPEKFRDAGGYFLPSFETTVSSGGTRMEGFGGGVLLNWIAVEPGIPFRFTMRLVVGSGPFRSMTEQEYEVNLP